MQLLVEVLVAGVVVPLGLRPRVEDRDEGEQRLEPGGGAGLGAGGGLAAPQETPGRAGRGRSGARVVG